MRILFAKPGTTHHPNPRRSAPVWTRIQRFPKLLRSSKGDEDTSDQKAICSGCRHVCGQARRAGLRALCVRVRLRNTGGANTAFFEVDLLKNGHSFAVVVQFEIGVYSNLVPYTLSFDYA
jgi:hypothetical protein